MLRLLIRTIDFLKKRTPTSSSLTCGSHTAQILIPWILFFDDEVSATSLSQTKI